MRWSEKPEISARLRESPLNKKNMYTIKIQYPIGSKIIKKRFLGSIRNSLWIYEENEFFKQYKGSKLLKNAIAVIFDYDQHKFIYKKNKILDRLNKEGSHFHQRREY
jgi:hypothetical protein